MNLDRQMRNGKEVWVDTFSGELYEPIKNRTPDPLILPALRASVMADAIRKITDTLHDKPDLAEFLINYALDGMFEE